ncbi:uncharacterized protein LOC126576790 [Anopheles aquasalis]|uniref:uncharacterized protein LOC126576790 n=1 Tax=Anopheles aquasalis TaxID=42839 RepID=UPI00215AD1D3|nr:uncharacterized protein LOC126576790 [Anopheles aquasalis]
MESLKSQIRGVLISNRKQMTVQNLMADFKSLEGEDIPYKQFGFKTLEDLLRTMPDVLRVQGYGRQATIQLVLTKTTEHMRELVEKSKNSPQANCNWNRQNIPARRQLMSWVHPASDHRSNEKHNAPQPEKNNFYHNPLTEKNAKRMIEIVAKNVDHLISEAPVQVNNGRAENATIKSKLEVSEKNSEAPDTENKQLPAFVPCTTASFQDDTTTEQSEENNIDIFEPLPLSVKIGSLVPALCVSPVSTPHCIHVQLQQNVAKLHSMSLQMRACHEDRFISANSNGSQNKPKHIRPGKYCSVKDNEDWFRGLILSRPEGGTTKVYFIDSGAVNLVPTTNVFHLPNKYRFPRQLVGVTMGDIKPIGDRWSEGALRYINQAIAHKRMHMLIRAIDEKTKTLDAVLIDSTGPEDVILSRELVRRREAIWCDRKCGKVASMDEDIATVKSRLRALLISSGKSRMSLKELAEEFRQTEGEAIPYANFGFRTIVDFARSISDVLQLHGRPDDQDALVSVVANATVSHIQYLVGQNKKNSKPKKSGFTAKKVPSTFHLQRAKQIEKLPSQSAKNYRSPATTAPYKIPTNQQKPITGCTKANNQQAKQYERPIPNQNGKNYHQPAAATPNKSPKNQQKQYTGRRTMNANTSPTSAAQPTSVQSRINQLIPKEMSIDWINCLNIPPDVMGLGWCMEMPLVERLFKPKAKQPVTVLSIVNPNRLWITTSSLQSVYDGMSKDLQSCYGDPAAVNRWDLQAAHVCYGLYCAAHWREKWHRAQIVGPLQSGSQLVKLRFIDYGRTELVHLSSIKYLVKSFQSFPACAVRASLAYIIPREHYWNRNHVKRLYSLLLPHVTYTAYIVDANPSTQAVDIILYDPTGTQNINQLLAKSISGRCVSNIPEIFDIAQYRNRVKCYSESHPSFLDIEEGRYPSVDELERSFLRGFDYDQHYAQCIHDQAVKQKIFEEHKLTLERILYKYIRSATNPFACFSS